MPPIQIWQFARRLASLAERPPTGAIADAGSRQRAGLAYGRGPTPTWLKIAGEAGRRH